MNEIILNYIVQAILGGASGYITNDYAINMLFKEYTPLKIGGVIKKTRPEFIDNLSSMVENDIINKEKLQEIINDESFKKEFEKLTADFYENCLYEATGNSTFADISGFDSTIKSTDFFIAEMINEHLPSIAEMLLNNVNINMFLNEKQLSHISDSIYTIFTDIFSSSDMFENILFSIYENNSELTPDTILGKGIYEPAINNLVKAMAQAASNSDSSQVKEILITTGIAESLGSSMQMLLKRKVSDVVSIDSHTLESINAALISWVNSENGNSSINSLTNSIFSYGRECNKSVFQLLDSDFERNLNQYLVRIIPSFTDSIVNLINENSNLIDFLIEESIDEVIRESDGIKAKLLSTIKNTYLKGSGKKYSVADKIVSYVRKEAKPEELSKNICVKLIGLLDEITIGDIVEEIELKASPENAVKAIIDYINKDSKALLEKFTAYLGNMNLNQIIPYEQSDDKLATALADIPQKLCESNKVKSYISDNLTKHADGIMSAKLGSMIDKDGVQSFAPKIKNFVKTIIISNEDSIKKWIETQAGKAALTFPPRELNPNYINLLNNELYKKYKNEADKLKDTPISAALDKLNSIESLSRNSSEALREYTADNAGVILSGSIKTIVADNLNKFSDDELVNFANDFIGRNLKPIMYFGGVLGVIAGVILAAFQRSPLDPAKISIANMAVYSFVGFITNVIAINMIFKPYRENKLLSKIPFFRNFSLGYIVKNQKIFAESTASLIENYLLNKKSINELFDKYRDKIKDLFNENITQPGYKTMNRLFENNKHNFVKKPFSYLKNKVTSNLNRICRFLFSKVKTIKIDSVINEKMSAKAGSLLTKKMQEHSYENTVYSLVNSESTLESKISYEGLKKYISGFQEGYYDKLCNILSREDEFKGQIIKLENVYGDLMNRQLDEFIDSEKQEKLAHSAAEKLNGIVLSKDSRDRIIQGVLSALDNSVNKNQNFEEVFNGRLKDYIDSHIPGIIDSLSEAAKVTAGKNKGKITAMIQSAIKDNLGFIEKGMYNLIGGDEITDELITNIIAMKLPKLLNDKKPELNDIVEQLLKDRFYKTKVNTLYTGINKQELSRLTDDCFSQENSINFSNRINKITKDMFSKAGTLKLGTIFSVFKATDLSSFLDQYTKEINEFSNMLATNLKDNRAQVTDIINEYSYSLIDELMKSKFKDLFDGISYEDVSSVINKASDELISNNLEEIISSSIMNLKDYLHISVEDLIDKEEFIKSAENCFIDLLDNKDFERKIQEHIEAIIEDAVSSDFSFIDNETKKHVLNIFTDSCVNSLKRNLDELLRAVEFDVIAKEEIEKMEPEKIHQMFNSFAGKYFRTLMLYGFGGFVFGINTYVGMSLTLLKILSEVKNNVKSKKSKQPD
jgi:uncharacterized membrane protein YheB (UPF0754 family)